MKTPVALLNLWHERTKTLVSVGGVTFALLLVFAQLGFQGAVSYTATNIFSNLKFDLLLRSKNYVHLYEPGSIHRQTLATAENVPGVDSAYPFWIVLHNWRRLDDHGLAQPDADLQAIAIMAIQPTDPVFIPQDIHQLIQRGLLDSDRSLLIDSYTQRPFEPRDGQQFGERDIDTEAEIGDARFKIKGVYRLGTGLAANGAVITSDCGFARIMPWNLKQSICLGLINLEPGASDEQIKQVKQELIRQLSIANPENERFPTIVSVLTRDEALEAERYRWLRLTPIGLIFQLGVVISLVVGAAIVYMVLATDVTERLPEYATLLAVGYSRLYLARLVMTQAIVLALLGFMASWVLAELFYRAATNFSGIPMSMDMPRVVVVFILGLAMCCFSGLLALRKLWKAEPANLF